MRGLVHSVPADAGDVQIMARELIELAQRICGSSEGHAMGSINAFGQAPEVERTTRLVALADEELRRRRLRMKFLPRQFFGEGAWAMLLDLFVSQFRGRRVPTTSACIAAEVPATTALRWLDVLEQHSLIERYETEHDRRVKFVRLTADGYKAVEAILSSY